MKLLGAVCRSLDWPPVLKVRNVTRRNIVRLFESRKGHLDYRIKRDYIRNGIATIPCKISDYSDVISAYSVKDYETLNTEFVDYLKAAADVMPTEYPIVLNIIGDCLTEEEKKTIEETILDEFAYDLGMVEKEEKRHKRVFYIMFVGLLVSMVLLYLTRALDDEQRELFFVPFYFMGDTLCDYIFLTGHDLRRDRRQAGRLASIKVVFSESYETPDYTERDFERLYYEIEKDVNETTQDEEISNEEAVYD